MKSIEDRIHNLDTAALASLTTHLSSFVTTERAERIDRILAARTRHVTVVLENVYRTHNASAVLRTCECFGVQDVHVIESSNPFNVNSAIVQGSAKWITMRRYRGPGATDSCLQRLKEAGHVIVAMNPEPESVCVDSLPLEAPLAICFGSEEPGLSRRARELANITATIPMHGFTQSLNLSVSAGIALRSLEDRVRRADVPWTLPDRDRDELRALWLARSLSSGSQIVRRHLESGFD